MRKLEPRDIVIGTCGQCGGQVVGGMAGRVGGMFMLGLRDSARCAECGARPAPLPMVERRKERKP
jgi:hypothetical protein